MIENNRRLLTFDRINITYIQRRKKSTGLSTGYKPTIYLISLYTISYI